MASKKPSSSPAPSTPRNRAPAGRPAITLERVRAVCPNANVATAVADTFGLAQVDFDDIKAATDEHLRAAAETLTETLHERQLHIHLQRTTHAFVASAFGAGQFYSDKVSEARRLTAGGANDDRDEDRGGPVGFDSRAERAREFAAKACMQAFALLAVAEGAAAAFEHLTGETWKPHVASVDNTQTVARRAADLELGAFG
jgi:hypothetical protein